MKDFFERKQSYSNKVEPNDGSYQSPKNKDNLIPWKSERGRSEPNEGSENDTKNDGDDENGKISGFNSQNVKSEHEEKSEKERAERSQNLIPSFFVGRRNGKKSEGDEREMEDIPDFKNRRNFEKFFPTFFKRREECFFFFFIFFNLLLNQRC